MITAPPVTATAPASVSTRLAWLDALRGIGAIAVVAEHALPWMLPAMRPMWVHLGIYGVMVFFLVSGYIIPASLEHRGDIRVFWISRLFRLYPLYLAVLGLTLAVAWWMPVREVVQRDASSVAAHLTMLLDTVQRGGVVDTMWTLSYEMIFYMLVTALFVAGAHRHSGRIAMAFGVAAVCTGLVVTGALQAGGLPAFISCGIFVAGVACLVSGRFRKTAAGVLGVMALVLLFGTGFVPWLGVAIIAVMFTGTAIYRWERGTGPLWPVFVTAGLVALSPIFAHQANWRWVQPGLWITTLTLAALTFAIGMALRRRRVPAFLAWLGLVSYSVYLVHHPILRAITRVTGDLREAPLPRQAAAVTVGLVLILGASWLTYRYIEKPMQALGKRIGARVTARATG